MFYNEKKQLIQDYFCPFLFVFLNRFPKFCEISKTQVMQMDDKNISILQVGVLQLVDIQVRFLQRMV